MPSVRLAALAALTLACAHAAPPAPPTPPPPPGLLVVASGDGHGEIGPCG